MKMKDKIIDILGAGKLEHWDNITFREIHLADLTERTKGKERLKIYETKQIGIDTLLINNPDLDITATFFLPQCFVDEMGNESENCEGVLYLSDSNERTWILFIEIKDCKTKNVSEYFTKTKDQIKSVVKNFRNKDIIDSNKLVYANISFPRRNKTDFYNQLIKADEAKSEFRDKHKILIRATNHLKIKNETSIY